MNDPRSLDQFMASLFFMDSSCANVARKESINSEFSPKVVAFYIQEAFCYNENKILF